MSGSQFYLWDISTFFLSELLLYKPQIAMQTSLKRTLHTHNLLTVCGVQLQTISAGITATKRLRISLLQSDDIDEEEQDNHDIDSTTADTVLSITSGLINVATLMHSPIF